jgi:hypothetical protein
MTSPVGRLYAIAIALALFFVAWAALAAHPWQSASPDPGLQEIAVREARLRHEAKLVDRVVALAGRPTGRRSGSGMPRSRRRRIASPRSRQPPRDPAAAAQAAAPAAAAAPPVRVVILPPLTITRTS